jgi:hypothetical protein
MQRKFTFKVLATALIFSFGLSTAASASPEREFIMSCTYGVLAGTLVGAATLAFTSNPGENLQNVARGASLGLYAGIGLGFYTVYVLPKQLEKEQEKIIEGETEDKRSAIPRVLLFPLADRNRVSGGMALWQVSSF